ncbi:DUF3299 domain-containing protein [Asticcacaulis sp. SL142]|uniref:DUF3299 domain-containing protein n=1 Tax=Asticcacaulis sp. SL142 TaxID=2995155 RepID=UPI00226D157D|nr:DUF3299 domain-containing protein [Asticcacaulis sp. SL142]WAC48245.1 DUF3299 domain-containing protein [Asticcacaulis sp. SL142]
MQKGWIIAGLCCVSVVSAADAQQSGALKPYEQVWKPAATPPGGIAWSVLESTKEIQRIENGVIYSKPVFPKAIKALAGKKIKVNGYMLPLENGVRQSRFVLLAYPPDCPFHLNPSPMQFIEVRAVTPVAMRDDVNTIEGTLVLTGDDEGGIFYKLVNSKEL